MAKAKIKHGLRDDSGRYNIVRVFLVMINAGGLSMKFLKSTFSFAIPCKYISYRNLNFKERSIV